MAETRPKAPAQSEPEPWLRGTLRHLPPLERAVLHSLELAREDVARWCGGLDAGELHARPLQLPSVAFHLRHIARSLDRFFRYADGLALSPAQRAALDGEMDARGSREEIFDEFEQGLRRAEERLRRPLAPPQETPLKIGRRGLPTSLGGLLVHMAEHTQRHVGQAITTAKVAMARRVPAAGAGEEEDRE